MVGHFFTMGDGSMTLKPALSLDEQIDLLISRGMIIEDVCSARDFLQDNNYFRLNIYFHKFMDDTNHFVNGLSLNHIVNIYENDKWLRQQFLKVLEPIEITFKSNMAYYLGRTYGAECLYTPDIFYSAQYFSEFSDVMQREIYHRRQEPLVVHHQNYYDGKFPVWVLVEFLSFNTTSRLFSNLLEVDKRIIAREAFNLKDFYVQKWLHALSVLRNICAHYDYLYKRTFAIKIMLLDRWKNIRNDDLFPMYLAAQVLSSETTFREFTHDLMERQALHTCFNLQDYGFPDNWMTYQPIA